MLFEKKDSIAALMILAILIISSVVVSAQEHSTIINSDPPGAAITLDGEYKLSATTPCRLPDNINGKFSLRAIMPGYESWNGDIVIIPGQENRFSFGMSAKTRYKAALRSLFMPGWGQYYAGEKNKAIFFNVLTIGAGIGTLVTDYDFRQKRDDYDQAIIDLGNASTYEEITELRQLVIDKNREAYDAETKRNTFAIVTAALWAYNVVDALVFFPERKLYFHQESIPIKEAELKPDVGLNKVGLKLTATF